MFSAIAKLHSRLQDYNTDRLVKPGRNSSLEDFISYRRYQFVKATCQVMLLVSSLLFLIFIYRLPQLPGLFNGDLRLVFRFMNLFTITTVLFNYLYVLRRNYMAAALVECTILSCIALYAMIIFGPLFVVSHIVFILVFLILTIALNRGAAIIYYFGIALPCLLLVWFSNPRIYFYSPLFLPRGPELLIIAIAAMGATFALLSRARFVEIEAAYRELRHKSKELLELNKNLDNKVKERTSELRSSYRRQAAALNEAVFSGNISRAVLHDLATPLSAIAGSEKLLEQSATEEQKDILQVLKSSLEQASHIVEQSRDMLAGREEKTEFSPDQAVTEDLSILKPLFSNAEIALEHKSDAPDVHIYGVRILFDRILANIISNAVDELRAKKDKRRLAVKSSATADYYVLEITDNGRGISNENLQQIFRQNYSTKEGGLGLGLPFVKNTIEETFNGKIEVSSENGTTFRLMFALHKHRVNTKAE